ncbi:nicotinate-nucleotide--dimethylbenzimidazole phosphoribosyltransferase [Peribacillus sp. SCS-37]|uniref:nicotinate-nucleotide--dimethylbenzimidazole phosphoribosyltransferase n=1 Tax=Paraperibacillus esterisolvens TaxID=3115296 RepID=UPI0039067F8A
MKNKAEAVINSITPLSKKHGREQLEHLNSLTKPPGSLGELEEAVIQLAAIKGEVNPGIESPGIVIFAADHGICAEGVSAYPQEVTGQMVLNFLQGGAAVNVFAGRIGAMLEVVDVGVVQDIKNERLRRRKIARGTNNFFAEDAMSRDQAFESILAGMESARELLDRGAGLLIPGEMGIGNTTSSTAIVSVVTGEPVELTAGLGTGIEGSRLLHKKRIIEEALLRRKPDKNDPAGILAAVGGFEIGAMTGAMLYAASRKVPILLDGFICTAAALIAAGFNRHASDYMIAGHQSAEPGHGLALRYLGKKPLLSLGMRLGEGSGAALAYPLLAAAVDMAKNMATFEGAGVSNKH